MENNGLFRGARNRVKYWWTPLIIGILAIFLSIWSYVVPGVTLVALSFVFVASFLIGGLMEIVFAISNKDSIDGWGWTLVCGIIDVLFAIFLITIPFAEVQFMIFCIAFLVLFQSMLNIGKAIDLQKFNIKGWGWVLAMAILGLILSFFLIIKPAFAATFIVIIFSVSLFFYGISSILYSIGLKKVRDTLKDIENDL